MAKAKITEIVAELLDDFLSKNGLELYDVKFVKEGKDWFLRVFIDRVSEASADVNAIEHDVKCDIKAEPIDMGSAEKPLDNMCCDDYSSTNNIYYVSTDDCELVSRYLSERLDEVDPIEQNYYLEVCSPGLDRELIRERDYIRYAGQPIDVTLYKAFEGQKSYLEARLIERTDEALIIEPATMQKVGKKNTKQKDAKKYNNKKNVEDGIKETMTSNKTISTQENNNYLVIPLEQVSKVKLSIVF